MVNVHAVYRGLAEEEGSEYEPPRNPFAAMAALRYGA